MRKRVFICFVIAAIVLPFAAGIAAEALTQPHPEKVTLESDRTVNIRSGPGTQYAQIGEAYPGANFFFTGTVENEFYQILYPSIYSDSGYEMGYVMQRLSGVSPVTSQDTILSSSIGDVMVARDAQIYLDAVLSIPSKGTTSVGGNMPYAGVSPGGSYAVLLNRTNDKGEEVLWIGYVSADEIGDESANDGPAVVRTNADGQWKYILEGGGAMVLGYHEYPTGDLVIPGSMDGHAVTSVSAEAFLYCERLTGVVIPEGVTSIGNEAFAGCFGLTHVTIPDSVTRIGEKAFETCRRLTSVNIPEGVRTIEEGTFFAGGLTSVMIPSSVTSIVSNPFVGCPLESIGVSSRNPAYEQIGGVLFDKRDKTLVSYPSARKGAYAIPEGVLRIGTDAFRYGADLTEITIPDSVTAIDAMAFNLCKSLTGVTIPGSVTSIGESAFSACNSLTTLAILDGVTSIGDRAFCLCDNLTIVTIPASVTAIGEDAFIKHGRWGRAADSVLYEGLTLTVTGGSFAEQYAKDNNIPYVLFEK